MSKKSERALSKKSERAMSKKSEKAPRKKKSAPKTVQKKPNFTKAQKIKNMKIIPKEACEQFLKLNTQTIQWQQ